MKTYAAGIIEHYDNSILIVLPVAPPEEPRWWRFPRGLVRHHEAPEAALRRIAKADLGVGVEIVAGQPPLVERIEGKKAELRYFFCGIAHGAPGPGPYAEIRWVPRAHMREYDFDEPSKPVAQWLVEA